VKVLTHVVVFALGVATYNGAVVGWKYLTAPSPAPSPPTEPARILIESVDNGVGWTYASWNDGTYAVANKATRVALVVEEGHRLHIIARDPSVTGDKVFQRMDAAFTATDRQHVRDAVDRFVRHWSERKINSLAPTGE
jgi:hypothetical protein